MKTHSIRTIVPAVIALLLLAPVDLLAQHYEHKAKSDLRANFNLAPVVATRIRNDDSIALQGLREYLIASTEINPSFKSRTSLDSPTMMRYPFIYINAGQNFQFMKTEQKQIGEYLTAGGFLVLEFDPAAYAGLKDILPRHIRLKPVPPTHEIYSIFYEFDQHLWREHIQSQLGDRSKLIGPKLIGFWNGSKLVGIYSDKNIGDSWATYKRSGREDARLRLGVNLVAYALSNHDKLVTP